MFFWGGAGNDGIELKFRNSSLGAKIRGGKGGKIGGKKMGKKREKNGKGERRGEKKGGEKKKEPRDEHPAGEGRNGGGS